MKPRIDVNMDSVEIEGVKVPCPKHIASSEWTEFWERVKEMEDE